MHSCVYWDVCAGRVCGRGQGSNGFSKHSGTTGLSLGNIMKRQNWLYFHKIYAWRVIHHLKINSFLPNSQMLWSLNSPFCIKGTVLSYTEKNLDWQFLYILSFNTLPIFPCPELAFATQLHSKNSANLFDIRFSQIKKKKKKERKKSLMIERKTLDQNE